MTEPIGCGARDMIESLVLQAEILHPEDPFFPDLIRNHLDAFYKEYDKIAKIEDMHPEDVEEYHLMLLKLDLDRLNVIGGNVQPSITPDVQILKVGESGRWFQRRWCAKKSTEPKVLKMMRQQFIQRGQAICREYRKKVEFFAQFTTPRTNHHPCDPFNFESAVGIL